MSYLAFKVETFRAKRDLIRELPFFLPKGGGAPQSDPFDIK